MKDEKTLDILIYNIRKEYHFGHEMFVAETFPGNKPVVILDPKLYDRTGTTVMDGQALFQLRREYWPKQG